MSLAKISGSGRLSRSVRDWSFIQVISKLVLSRFNTLIYSIVTIYGDRIVFLLDFGDRVLGLFFLARSA